MSVYEYLTIEAKRIYSEKEILRQFLTLGCKKISKRSDHYEEAEKHGIIMSPEFINLANGIIRIPFYIPVLRSDKKAYNAASCNHQLLPLVVFEWVRRHFPNNTKIFWGIENDKLFEGQINNYFKNRKISKDWLKEDKSAIDARRWVHRVDE